MGLPARVKKFSPAEYLILERTSAYRSEYFQGEIFAMAGGTPRHSKLKTNLIIALGVPLRGHSCTLYDSDLRILVDQTGLYTYPDASIACGPLELADGQPDVVFNPTVLFEVFSDSSEAYDRGQKFGNYRQIESLREYVLVSQKEVLVERFERNPNNTWTMTESRGIDSQLALTSVGITIQLREIYDKVDFSVAETEAVHSPAAL